jgi:hypothetical protein
VDRVIFLGLGLKMEASRGIRKRLGRALSRLGLKPKLIIGRHRLKRKACGLFLRPSPLEADSQVKLKAGDVRAPKSILGQGESSSVKTPITPLVSSDETVSATPLGSSPVKSLPVSVSASSPEEEEELTLGSSESSISREVPSVSVEVMPEMESSLEKTPIAPLVCSDEDANSISAAPLGKSSSAKSLLVSVSSSEEEEELALGSSESSISREVPSVLVKVMPEMDLEQVSGKVATHHPSPKKGMLQRGFLL